MTTINNVYTIQTINPFIQPLGRLIELDLDTESL